MKNIPDELFLNVLQCLSRSELEKCQLVCRYFWKFLENFGENLPLRLIDQIWVTNEGMGILYSEDCKNGWDMSEDKIKKAMNFSKTKYLGITINVGVLCHTAIENEKKTGIRRDFKNG